MDEIAGNEDNKRAKFLIIDDQMDNIRLLERILERDGYSNWKSTASPREALVLCGLYQPDLILLDLHMPEMSGFDVLEVLRKTIPSGNYLPIVVLTADITPEAKRRALGLGATDFISKPFDRVEVLLRISNLLGSRFLHLQLQEQNRGLEQMVLQRTMELEELKFELLERLAKASEFRDDNTGQHTFRVGQLAMNVAKKLGLSETETELIRRTAPLHDVGKIGISDGLLLKPGKLTYEEFEEMKNHTLLGANILKGSRYALLQTAEQIAVSHHERWDGSGYPFGLKGEEIPIIGRIVTVVDIYDALTHERPYKQAWSMEAALGEIERQKGKYFDPEVLKAFGEMVRGGKELLN